MAEQPRPARAKAARPGRAAFAGSSGVRKNEIVITTGKNRKTSRSGIHRSIEAKSRRPPVTVAQKTVRASEAVEGMLDSVLDIKIDAQLPFIVSQMP